MLLISIFFYIYALLLTYNLSALNSFKTLLISLYSSLIDMILCFVGGYLC